MKSKSARKSRAKSSAALSLSKNNQAKNTKKQKCEENNHYK